MSLIEHCIIPDWPAPKQVRTLQTTRLGGVSSTPYDSLNLGDHVGDAPLAVAHNRMLLNTLLPSEPVWLEQAHGTLVANADHASCLPQADACIARHRAAVCVVMTADCLPVLLCDKQGSVVGAAHAGWKGLAAGVIEATVQAMDVAPQNLMAWLGPAISQDAFEVGDEVRAAFIAAQPQAASAFTPSPLRGEGGVTNDLAVVVGQPSQMASSSIREGEKWLADLSALARLRMNALGITQIYGGDYCTYRERERFFSYRRDGATGRMGTFIWLEK
jgi:YfiH family protein